jgi:hypothetical protein
MGIRNPQPPAGGDDLVSRRLDLGRGGQRLRVASEATGESALQIAQPHRVYVVPGEALERGQLLDAAEPVAWRYLLVDTENAFAAAEVQQRGDGPLVFSEMNEGPFVQSTADVLLRAERLDDVQRGDFELRLLKIPSRYLVALWLHAETADLILPLSPAPSSLEAGRAYTSGELANALA